MTDSTPHLEHISPKDLLAFPGLSQVVRVRPGTSTMVYLAGQSPFNPHFELIGGNDFKAQTAATLNNLAIAVRAAGGNPSDIISSTVYIKGLTAERSTQFFEAMAQALDGAAFPAHAISIIGIQELGTPEQLVEIVSVAAIQI